MELETDEVGNEVGLDSCYAPILEVNGSYRVTLDKRLVDANGWKQGDTLKVWLKRVRQKNDGENNG